MKELKWYFKNGTKFETYTVLYEDETFILVQNNNTKKYSFGVIKDFGSLYGFSVNQSCLTVEEAKETLSKFIEIDKQYMDCPFANINIIRWGDMIYSIELSDKM